MLRVFITHRKDEKNTNQGKDVMSSPNTRSATKRQREAEDVATPLVKKRRVQTVNYRSNIGSIIKLLRTVKLTKQHIDQIWKTPFWPIIEALMSPTFK